MSKTNSFLVCRGLTELQEVKGEICFVSESKEDIEIEYWNKNRSEILTDYLNLYVEGDLEKEAEKKACEFCENYGLPVYQERKLNHSLLGLEFGIEYFINDPYYYHNKVSRELFWDMHKTIKAVAIISMKHSDPAEWNTEEKLKEYVETTLITLYKLWLNQSIIFFDDYHEIKVVNSIRFHVILRKELKDKDVYDAITCSIFSYLGELKEKYNEYLNIIKKIQGHKKSKYKAEELLKFTRESKEEEQRKILFDFFSFFIDLLASYDVTDLEKSDLRGEEETYFQNSKDALIEQKGICIIRNVVNNIEISEIDINSFNFFLSKVVCDYLGVFLKWINLQVGYTGVYSLGTSIGEDAGCFGAIILALTSSISNNANLRICKVCKKSFFPASRHPNQETCSAMCSKIKYEQKRKGRRKRTGKQEDK